VKGERVSGGLEQLYQQLILEHNRNPRNFGPLAAATHSARGYDALCGDDILIELKIEDGRIVQAAFSGDACAVTRASASMLTEWLKGRNVEDLPGCYQRFHAVLRDTALPPEPELGELDHLRAVGEFPARIRNAELPWQTAIKALKAH
jgi:nitrogen fixation NifU-like protein